MPKFLAGHEDFPAETIQLENAQTSGRSRRFPAETIQLENAQTAGRSLKFQAETNQLQNARNAGRPETSAEVDSQRLQRVKEKDSRQKQYARDFRTSGRP